MKRKRHFILLFSTLLLASKALSQENRNVKPVIVSLQDANQRTALIIGNAAYKESPLANPVNDAQDMANALKACGFQVDLHLNVTAREIKEAIRGFGQQLQKGGVGLFYFAGHGIQVNGQNYLIPLDANIQKEQDIEHEAVDLGRVLGEMEHAQNNMNVLILDACRNNPFARSFRSATRGLASIDAPRGSLIAYATAPGKVAADGTGRNGLYTQELLKQIQVSGLKIEEVFKQVRTSVVEKSRNAQIPWESSSLTGDFYFRSHQSSNATVSPDKTSGRDATIITAPNKATQISTLCVAEFRTQGIPTELQWLGRDFPDALISEFSKARTIRVVEREYLEKILSELKLQSSTYIDPESAVQIGRLLGAHNFVFGSVSFLGNNVLVRARIVNIERAEVIGTADVTGDQENIFKIQVDLARQIASKMAVEAALAEESGSAPSKMKLSVYQDLDRLQQFAKDLPLFGFDPARVRKEGDYRFALSICDNILAEHPKLIEAHYYRALFSLHSNKLQDAQQESEIVQSLDPNYVENLSLRGNLFYLMKDFNGAKNAFNEAIKKSPDDARAWYGRARLAIANGDKVDAVAACLATLERAPIIPEAETNLQTLIGGSDGHNVLAQIKSQRPEIHPAAMVFRAFWKNEWKNLDGIAEQATNQFQRLYMGHYVRGLLEEARGNSEKAEVFFKTCLSLRPSFSDVHRSLGVMYLKKGRCDEGRQHVTLYLSTAAFVNDYNEIEQHIRRCEEKNKGK